MADELVTITEYPDSIQAQMAVQVLADYDIKAVLLGQHAADVFGGVMPYFATVKLQVRQNDAEQAKHILESQETSLTQKELEELDDMGESGELKTDESEYKSWLKNTE